MIFFADFIKENQVIVGPGCPGNPIMSENATPDRAGPADAPDPPLTTETLVALAHAHRQGIPYETREHLLQHLPERLRALSDLVLGGEDERRRRSPTRWPR